MAERELLKEFRGQFFVWFGIVGGALTIVNHWSNVITLANWMHWLVNHFGELLYEFWSLFGIQKGVASLLSFMLFYSSITIGSILINKNKRRLAPNIFIKIPVSFIVFLTAFAVSLFIITLIAKAYAVYIDHFFPFKWIDFYFVVGISAFISCAIISDGTLVENAILVISNSILLLVTRLFAHNFSEILPGMTDGSLFIKFIYFIVFIYFVYCVPVAFAPARGLIKRISFMLIGVGFIFMLSELSKLVAHWQIAT